MTRRSERMVLEISYDDAREDPPHTWSWECGVELAPRTVKVLAILTPDATRAVLDEEPVPDPYGNGPFRPDSTRWRIFPESDEELRSERRLWESGL